MQTVAAVEPRLFTVLELAEITRSSPATIRNMIRTGALPAVRWGVELRVSREALNKYLEDNAAKGPAAVRHPGRNGRPAGRPRRAASAQG